jgi:hypothetical protein
MKIPSPEEFRRGYQEFQRREKGDAMYKIASFLADHFWGKPAEMADGLGVLLLTWNQALYRYGSFDFDKLEKCMADNLYLLAPDYFPLWDDQIARAYGCHYSCNPSAKYSIWPL